MKKYVALFLMIFVIPAFAFAGKPGDKTAPVTTASPAGGTYSTAQTVTLTVNEAATTYYTIDGTTPTTSSPVYAAPVNIAVTTTLQYFSKDTAGNIETVKTQVYTISGGSLVHPTLSWTGYGMCKDCHLTQAQGMYQSAHYQWKGSAAEWTTGPATQGKMDALDGSSALNAYCINILGNWNACAACHLGTGAKPVATGNPSAAQLSSIDCLMCHSATYARTRNATTGLFEPKVGIDMNSVVRTVIKPTRAQCLNCHAKAGGGDAVKRGDLALASATSNDLNYDIHMATSRGNLPCQGCHTFNGHKVTGRGSDLRPQDSTAAVNCSTTSCHPTKANLSTSHTTYDTSHHVGRVACQSCHAPRYAKDATDVSPTPSNPQELTETHRNWAVAEWNSVAGRYEPTPTKAGNLIPKYAFWSGSSWGNNLMDAAVLDPATGAYKISRPVGAINDTNSKLYPFKYKTASQALDTTVNKLIAINTATYFASGNYTQAVLDGLANMGRTGDAWTTVTTDEYQLLNHQVPQSSGNVLACTACHPNASATQMKLVNDFGYALKGPTSVICAVCHQAKNPTQWDRMHNRHVATEGFDCSFCHNFTRAAERGLSTTPH